MSGRMAETVTTTEASRGRERRRRSRDGMMAGRASASWWSRHGQFDFGRSVGEGTFNLLSFCTFFFFFTVREEGPPVSTSACPKKGWRRENTGGRQTTTTPLGAIKRRKKQKRAKKKKIVVAAVINHGRPFRSRNRADRSAGSGSSSVYTVTEREGPGSNAAGLGRGTKPVPERVQGSWGLEGTGGNPISCCMRRMLEKSHGRVPSRPHSQRANDSQALLWTSSPGFCRERALEMSQIGWS